MRRLAILPAICLAIYTSPSTVIHASDEPPFTALASSSYYGAFGFDEVNDLAVDADGYVYIAGWTEGFVTGFDGFVVKLSPDGSQVLYESRIGGSAFDIIEGIAIDPAGGIIVVGHTTSADFPVVNGFQQALQGDSDLFLARLDANGHIAYSTYYGGSSFENGMAVALGPTGAIYVAGSTGSTDLPGVTGVQGHYAGGFADAFVAKIAADGSGPLYASYLGGSDADYINAVAVDAADHAYVAGMTMSHDFPVASSFQPEFRGGFSEAFVTKFSPEGGALEFSTYAGGFDFDSANAIAIDGAGTVYVAGSTASFDFPTMNPWQPYPYGAANAFLAKLTSGGELMYSTMFGGNGYSTARRIGVDADGNMHIAGEVFSFTYFPVEKPLHPIDEWQYNVGDAFYAKFSPDGQTLLRSTTFGGAQFDTAGGLGLTASGDVWIAGRTESSDLPIVHAFQPYYSAGADAFVARLTSTYTDPASAPRNTPPVADAGDDQTLFTDMCGTDVVLDGSRSYDPDGDPLQYTWSSDQFGFVGTGQTYSMGLGGEIPQTFRLTVSDGHGGSATDTVTITIVDNTPPEILAIGATPAVLGPPNHNMVDVGVNVKLNDQCDPSGTCHIVSVASSEPENGIGDGDTAPDWEITGPLTLRLRAERSAAQHAGGRIYTVTIECVDYAGNAVQRTVTVAVPKN
jgi:hypothetical protein